MEGIQQIFARTLIDKASRVVIRPYDPELKLYVVVNFYVTALY